MILLKKKKNIKIFEDNNLELIFKYILKEKRKKIIILNLKKNYFNDISWLWEINFNCLKNKKIEKIIIYGNLKYDLYNRLLYAKINPNKIIIENIFSNKLMKYLKKELNIYIISFNDINNIKNLIKEEGKIYEYKNCASIL